MCMTKNHMNMDSHSYRNVHDKNPYKNNMDSHSYINLNDENQKKGIVICTEMCMKKKPYVQVYNIRSLGILLRLY